MCNFLTFELGHSNLPPVNKHRIDLSRLHVSSLNIIFDHNILTSLVLSSPGIIHGKFKF